MQTVLCGISRRGFDSHHLHQSKINDGIVLVKISLNAGQIHKTCYIAGQPSGKASSSYLEDRQSESDLSNQWVVGRVWSITSDCKSDAQCYGGSNPSLPTTSGIRTAWLLRLIWDQEVEGSNPSFRTIIMQVQLSRQSAVLITLRSLVRSHLLAPNWSCNLIGKVFECWASYLQYPN